MVETRQLDKVVVIGLTFVVFEGQRKMNDADIYESMEKRNGFGLVALNSNSHVDDFDTDYFVWKEPTTLQDHIIQIGYTSPSLILFVTPSFTILYYNKIQSKSN